MVIVVNEHVGFVFVYIDAEKSPSFTQLPIPKAYPSIVIKEKEQIIHKLEDYQQFNALDSVMKSHGF